MKKLFKLFTLAIALFCAFLLTGCATEDEFEKVTNPTTENIIAKEAELKANNINLIGLYNIEKDVLYLNVASLLVEEGNYYYVTGNVQELPSMTKKGANFSGWYKTEDFKSGTRVTSGVDQNVLYAKYMSFAEAGIVAVVCMSIVFGMLALIAGIISLFKFITPKEKQTETPVQKSVTSQAQVARPALKLEDITDEDMMAAALVATIDYHEETKEDVRVVSIKQIG